MKKMRFHPQLFFGVALCGAVFACASTRGEAPEPKAPGATPKVATPKLAAREKPYRVTQRITLQDARIDESSGLCRSVRHPNFLWTHNDSGDAARMFLLDENGNTRAVANLEGAKNLDWEDCASGPRDAKSAAWIYVGDIGDNLRKRESITIYRFREPALPASTRAAQNASPALANAEDTNARAPQLRVSCEAMTLRYPDGAHDAEALMIAPNGRVLIATKSLGGGTVFLAPQSFANGSAQTMRAVGELRLPDDGWGNLATGGDISEDGTRLVLRTYAYLHEWKRDPQSNSDEAWRALFRQSPTSFPPPEMPQSEAACYDARGKLFLSSEKLPAPLVQMER